MAIHSIDKVTIDGSNKAFGGFIYAVDYDVGVIDQPSKIVITLVNDNGNYIEPDLSVSRPYLIQIGNIISGKFYAIERKIQKSSSGRTLEVVFYDGSIILDRLWVGLHKRMGNHGTSQLGLIIVGKEIHPCDVNEDGVFNQADANLLAWQGYDPCELKCPAESESRESVIEECLKKEMVNVFPIKYSIGDLFNALEGAVPNGSPERSISYPVDNDLEAGSKNGETILPALETNKNTPPANRIKIKQRPKIINTFFKAEYTGTLREVLKSWCGDFGWSFTWENDELVFLDTKVRPKLVEPNFKDRLRSFSDTKTLEGTVSRGFNSTYLHEGISSSKDCKQSEPIMLHCLTLRDLFGDAYYPQARVNVLNQSKWDFPAPIGRDVGEPPDPAPDPLNADETEQIEYKDDVYKNGVPIEQFEAMCVCAKYGNVLRNLYVQWNYYRITSFDRAKLGIGQWLDRMGQCKILCVYSRDGDKANKEHWGTLLSGKGIGTQKKPYFSEEQSDEIKKNNGIILVVQRRSKHATVAQVLQVQHQLENRLASSFMGQHWYRAYTAPSYGHMPQIFPDARYLSEMSMDVNDLSFAHFHHSQNSKVGNIVSAFLQKHNNDYQQFNPKAAHFSYGSKGQGQKIMRSMVYYNRASSDGISLWSPIENTQEDFKKILDTYGPLAPRVFDLSNQEDYPLANKRTVLTTTGGVSAAAELTDTELACVDIIVVFPPPQKPAEVLAAAGQHADLDPLHLTYSFGDHINKTFPQHTESSEPFGVSTAGMLSNKCVVYDVAGKKVYTPIGASVHFHTDKSHKVQFARRSPTTKDFSDPAFKVFITSSVSNRGLIPKTEITYVDYADITAARRVEYKTHALDRNSIRFLNKLTNECRLDPAQILALHKVLAKNLNFSVVQPFRSLQYEIFGVTVPDFMSHSKSESLSPSKGLESLKIRIDGQGGITTSISLGDKLFTPISENVILHALENGILPRLASLMPNPI